MNLRFFVKSSTFKNSISKLIEKIEGTQTLYNDYIDSLFEKNVKNETRIGQLESALFQSQLGERVATLEAEVVALTEKLSKTQEKINTNL